LGRSAQPFGMVGNSALGCFGASDSSIRKILDGSSYEYLYDVHKQAQNS